MKIRIYPFQVLRENKQAQGAHADRIQTGMSKAYGKPIGRAARVRPGQIIISVLVDEPGIKAAKAALLKSKSRINCELKVKIGTDVERIGTKPKKTRAIKLAEAAKEEKESEEKAEKGNGKADEGKKDERKKEEGKGNKKESKKK